MSDADLMRLIGLKAAANAAWLGWQQAFPLAQTDCDRMRAEADVAEARYRLAVEDVAR